MAPARDVRVRPPPSGGAVRARGYWREARSPRYSIVFALPLLLLYELLAVTLPHPAGGGVRNGADVILRELFTALAGRRGPALLMGVVIATALWLIWRDVRRNGRGVRPAVFAGMTAEAVVYALAFGVVVGMVTAQLLGTLHLLALAPAQALGPAQEVMVSLGAGLYEELLFRVVLVSAIAFGARALFGWGPRGAGVLAVLLSAAIFSAFHYVGPYGDVLTLPSFTFRFIGGIFFSALYLLRGFGITAWTHALYDLFLLLLGG